MEKASRPRRLSSVRAYMCVCYSKNGFEVDCPSGIRGGFIVGTILPLLYVIPTMVVSSVAFVTISYRIGDQGETGFQ
jgi:hypothetical protein